MNPHHEELSIEIPSPIEAIDRKRRLFSRMKTALFSSYLEKKRTEEKISRLLVLNGWGDLSNALIVRDPNSQLATSSIGYLMTAKDMPLRTGGYFLQVDGKGIAINPGKDFIERFHRAGYHIWDIDHVIVTDKDPKAFSDIETLWRLNKEVNSLLFEWKLEPHVIRYWLHPTAFDTLSFLLRPIFRQEKGCVNRLETFQDNTSLEMTELSHQMNLWFMRSMSDPSSSLLIRIESAHSTPLSIGFLFHTLYNENIASFFHSATHLVIGAGNILFEEVAKMEPNPNSLGYFGALELIRQLPKETVIVISEMGMLEGDTRLEILKQLELDLEKKSKTSYAILPAEEGLTLHLHERTIVAPGLEEITPIQGLRVVRSSGLFSRLTYIDEASIY